MKLLLKVLVLVFLLSTLLSGCMTTQNTEDVNVEDMVTFIPTEEIPVEDDSLLEEQAPLEEGMTENSEEQAVVEEAEETVQEGIASETEGVQEETVLEEETQAVEEESSEISSSAASSSAVTIEVNEGELVSLDYTASDPDGDTLYYTYSAPLDENGIWQTNVGDAGEYFATLTASDGKGGEATLDINIIVNPINKAPLIELSDVFVDEGDTIVLEPVVTDPDGDDVTVSYSGWMDTNTYKTTYQDAGSYDVVITASDGQSDTSKTIKVTVTDVNRAPILDTLSDLSVKEGEKVSVSAVAADPDGDDVSLTYGAPLDSAGEWQTAEGDAGEYDVLVKASDGTLESSKSFTLVVEAINKAPTITVSDVTVDEGDVVVLEPVVSDADGDDVSVTYSGWMSTNTYQTSYTDQGEHTVTVSASDGKTTSTATLTVTVNDINRAPTFG